MTDESQEQNPLSRNFLGKNFYVVVTTPTASREKLEPLIPAHLANQVRLEKEGIMFNLRSYTLMRWTINEGSYGVRVNYSDQSVTIE